MFRDKNNREVNNLVNLMSTTNNDKRTTAYSAVALYIVNESPVIKNKSLNDDDYESTARKIIIEFGYQLNDIVVVDIDMLASVAMKFVRLKKNFMKIDSYTISETDTLLDILGVRNELGDSVETLSNNFAYYKNTFNALARIAPFNVETDTEVAVKGQ